MDSDTQDTSPKPRVRRKHPEPDRLYALPIETSDDVEKLRQLRNATTDGFAYFNGIISPEQQRQWWGKHKKVLKGWLYWEHNGTTDERSLAGFGLLRREKDGHWYNSIGVSPEHRGKGYGRLITHDLLEHHDLAVYAVIRRDNLPSVKMHVLDEWEQIDGDDPQLLYLRSTFESTQSYELETYRRRCNCGPKHLPRYLLGAPVKYKTSAEIKREHWQELYRLDIERYGNLEQSS